MSEENREVNGRVRELLAIDKSTLILIVLISNGFSGTLGNLTGRTLQPPEDPTLAHKVEVLLRGQEELRQDYARIAAAVSGYQDYRSSREESYIQHIQESSQRLRDIEREQKAHRGQLGILMGSD